MANGWSLQEFVCLPQLDPSHSSLFQNSFIMDELNYNKDEMAKEHTSLLKCLTAEQLNVYEDIISSVVSEKGGFFFLYGYGGTGKTFMWRTLYAAVKSTGKIFLNVASSGIASLLLLGGKTTHSRFCITILLNEESTCNVPQGSHHARLLIKTKLIIWDEASMMNRMCFEAFDRTLRDAMRTVNEGYSQKPFGGKVVVLRGDFRQILSVVKKGSRCNVVKSTINSSHFWLSCRVLKLPQNMRLNNAKSNVRSANNIKEFSDWILKIGDGQIGLNENGECVVEIPHDLLIEPTETPLLSLVNFVYPNLSTDMLCPGYFEDGAILCPTTESVEKVNDFILSLLSGKEITYLSSDTPCQSNEDQEIEGEWFTFEFLNEITCLGIPNHRLHLKIGVPIMLLRNIDQVNGLCNGTRLQVIDLKKNVICAALTGTNIGDKIFISRMNLIPSDAGMPFKFQRRQLPIAL